MSIPVIALKGKSGVGKSTAAKYLAKRGYVRTSFATPLRAMLTAFGLSDEELSGALKEKPCAALSGRTPREALQLLGTEWGRTLSTNLWVEHWLGVACDVLDQDGHSVVVDDCRFPNEAQAIRTLGGVVIEVVSDTQDDGAEIGIAGHASEMQIFEPDILVVNDGKDLASFFANLDEAIALLESEAEDDRLCI